MVRDKQIAKILNESSFRFMSYGMIIRNRGVILIDDAKFASDSGILLGIPDRLWIDEKSLISAITKAQNTKGLTHV